jgi:hypothetical protein
MKTKRILGAAFLLVVLAIVASACGGDDSTTGTNTGASTTSGTSNDDDSSSSDFDSRPETRSVDTTADYGAATDSELKSELRNAAVAEQSLYTENESYSDELSDLIDGGFEPSQGIEVTVAYADAMNYCLETSNPDGSNLWHFDSRQGEPRQGRCTTGSTPPESP